MFLREQTGSMIPAMASMMLVMVGVVGVAVDMGRLHMVETKLSNSLDAAGLAAGATINGDPQTIAYSYMTINYPEGYMGSTLTSVTASGNADNSVITLSASASLQTTFLNVLGVSTLTANASSQITRASSGMELVMVMDNTGSMSQSAGGTTTKIQASKDAANALLDVLYGGNTSIPDLWVGLVPFSQAVNVSTASFTNTWMNTTYNSGLVWGTSSWYGCVEERSSPYDVTDDAPVSSNNPTLFKKYYASCNTSSSYSNKWYGTNSSHNNCLTGSGLQYLSTSNTTKGPNHYCPQPLTPMTITKSTIVSAISTMTPNGNTHINEGLVWGWRMLSPNWRGMWNSEMSAAGLPLDYDTPLMNKVVVLMTDGDNTLSGTNAASSPPSYPGLYSAFGIPNQNRLNVAGGECTSTGSCTAGEDMLNTMTSQICTSMKNHHITIYTIALGSSVSSTGQTLLRNCATDANHYFLSPTTDQLNAIFTQIGQELANLRISH